MVRQKKTLSIATRWQIIGMDNARLSCREIGRQLRTTQRESYTVEEDSLVR